MAFGIPSCVCCALEKTSGPMRYAMEALQSEFPDLFFTSGSRCEKHNGEVGGSPDSGHLPIWGPQKDESVAVDAQPAVWNRQKIREICRRAVQHGCRGVGAYEYTDKPSKNSLHFDMKPRTQFWYQIDGKRKYFFP